MSDLAQERIKSLEQRLTHEPLSPLFACLASYYLQVGRVKDALRLCDDGLAHYPFYTTAHVIKGKALAELGMMAEAKHEYEVVHEFLPTNETIAQLVSSVELGTSQYLGAPAPVDEAPQAKPSAMAMPQVALEEPVIEEQVQPAPVEDTPPQESVVTAEEPFAPATEPATQELAAQEPQTFEPTEVSHPVEDSFGVEEQPVAEPQPEGPGAAEKLGLDMQVEPQQTLSDFSFDTTRQEPPSAQVEEAPFGSQPMEEPQRTIEPEPEQQQEPSSFETPMTEAVQASSEPAAPVSETNGEVTPDWFEAFSQLQQPTEVAAETPTESAGEEENPFAMFGGDQSSEMAEGEPYDEFTARMGLELSGTENTITLEEYLGQASSEQPSSDTDDNIGELAERLKTSPRITPPVINFAEKASRPASEADTAGGSGFVTPTLAEIYVKQGWFDDAIKAYRALAANKPAEREKYEQRIAEIEGMKK